MCTGWNFEGFRLKPLKICIYICQATWETSKERWFYFLVWGFWDHIGGRHLNSQLLCRQGYGYKISRGNSLSSPPSPHKQGQGIQDTLTFPLLLDRFFSSLPFSLITQTVKSPSHGTDLSSNSLPLQTQDLVFYPPCDY